MFLISGPVIQSHIRVTSTIYLLLLTCLTTQAIIIPMILLAYKLLGCIQLYTTCRHG